jgi:hypothetical protein
MPVAWRPQALARKFEQPDDTTRFPNGFEDLVKVHGALVGLATFQPGSGLGRQGAGVPPPV